MRIRKALIGIGITIGCLIFGLYVFAAPAGSAEPPLSEAEIKAAIEEKGEDFYAYMDYDAAEDQIKPVIKEARRRVISQSDGWAQDGVDGYVLDMDGTVIEKIPQWFELFPTEWYDTFIGRK